MFFYQGFGVSLDHFEFSLIEIAENNFKVHTNTKFCANYVYQLKFFVTIFLHLSLYFTYRGHGDILEVVEGSIFRGMKYFNFSGVIK